MHRSNDISEPPISASSAGAQALEQLAAHPAGKVSGVTSAGIFITLESGKVVFVSEQDGRGPLSVYLGKSEPSFKWVQAGDRVAAGGQSLVFSRAGIQISLPQDGWRPAPPAKVASPRAEQRERLMWLAHHGLQSRTPRGLAKYLPVILGYGSEGTGGFEDEWQVTAKLRALQEAVDWKDSKLVETMLPLLGMGIGLTPSGDDLIVGMLLMINRWQLELFGENRLLINEAITREAWRRTTGLSASLIECAALGEADSRLVAVADCIACGLPNEETAFEGLLTWGSSSGLDTLAGMAVVT